MTLATWENGTAKVPAGMFSHSDQIMHWQTSVPDQRAALGWGGRVADLVSSLLELSRDMAGWLLLLEVITQRLPMRWVSNTFLCQKWVFS